MAKSYAAPPAMTIDLSKRYSARFETAKGDFTVELYADKAPRTVNNFVFLAREGFYDDTTFHRVINGFMAQAGDPTGTGRGGPGYTSPTSSAPASSTTGRASSRWPTPARTPRQPVLHHPRPDPSPERRPRRVRLRRGRPRRAAQHPRARPCPRRRPRRRPPHHRNPRGIAGWSARRSRFSVPKCPIVSHLRRRRPACLGRNETEIGTLWDGNEAGTGHFGTLWAGSLGVREAAGRQSGRAGA